MIFMAWAFYVETTGRGALFVEPNRLLAAGELATVATGMVANEVPTTEISPVPM